MVVSVCITSCSINVGLSFCFSHSVIIMFVADLAYRQSSFEPHVLGNGDGNRALSEGTTVYGNTSDGSLIGIFECLLFRELLLTHPCVLITHLLISISL